MAVKAGWLAGARILAFATLGFGRLPGSRGARIGTTLSTRRPAAARAMTAAVAVVVLVSTLIVVGPVSGRPAGAAAGVSFVRTDYPIRELPRAAWPYIRPGKATSANDGGVYDAHGVAMRVFNGVAYDHPVRQAQAVLARVPGARGENSAQDLARARVNAARLIDRAVMSRGAMYFPYPFDFALHRDTSDMMVAPWYSGLAQGQALSAFVRLFEATGETRYRDAAHATFASFKNMRAPGVPWVVDRLPGGYVWFEEYPKWRGSDRTVNGHIFALFGLYDYHRLTRDPEAARLFQAGVTSTEAMLPRIRVRGGMSVYCPTHRVPNASYHAVHVEQLMTLYDMTGAPSLARWADRFHRDYPVAQGPAQAYLATGWHRGLRLDDEGRSIERRRFRLAAAQGVAIDKRGKILGRRGIWLRVASGELAGYWVRERPMRSFVRGTIERYGYDLPRPLAMTAGEHTGYRFDPRGLVAARHTARLLVPSEAHVTARAVISGRLYFQVMDGIWAGYWISAGPDVTLGGRVRGRHLGTAAAAPATSRRVG
jgi:hypothetical protein